MFSAKLLNFPEFHKTEILKKKYIIKLSLNSFILQFCSLLKLNKHTKQEFCMNCECCKLQHFMISHFFFSFVCFYRRFTRSQEIVKRSSFEVIRVVKNSRPYLVHGRMKKHFWWNNLRFFCLIWYSTAKNRFRLKRSKLKIQVTQAKNSFRLKYRSAVQTWASSVVSRHFSVGNLPRQ